MVSGKSPTLHQSAWGANKVATQPFEVQRSEKPKPYTARFSVADIKRLCAAPIFSFCRSGIEFTASDLRSRIGEFRVYQRSNAIGDALGHAHKGSFGLHHVGGKTPRTFLPSYENAALVYNSFSDQELEDIASELDMDRQELRNEISKLPKLALPSEAGGEKQPVSLMDEASALADRIS